MKAPNLAHAARIARVEVRRSVRAVGSSNTRTAAFGVALLFWVALPTVGGGFLAYQLGRALPGSSLPFPVLDLVRGASAVGWVGLAALAAARTGGKKGELDSPEGILTTVPARDAALGLLLAEYARIALVAAIPVLTIATALAVGSGVLAPLATVPATAALVLAIAVAIGFPVGIAIKWVTHRSPWLARHKTALLVAAFGLYFLAVTSEAFSSVVATLQRALRDTPLAWFGDAALLGLPGIAAVPVHALGAVALAVLLVPAFAALAIRAATTLWYTDRAQADDEDDPERETRPSRTPARTGVGERVLTGAFGQLLARPTRTVTLAVWRRTQRAPIRLLYVAYPLFFLYAPLRTAFESGVPTSLPILVALYGTWATGATVLNPLGDEGAVLPATLLSGIDGRQFVLGHVLSAALVGVPVVTLATAIAGALSPLALTNWLALTAISVLLVVAGSMLAVAVGVLFPRFGTVEVFRSREITMPSKGAFAAYSLVLLGGAIAAMVALLGPVAGFVGGLVAVPQVAVRVFGGLLAVLVGVVGPALAFRWAAEKFETFVVD